jgi:hypothetical protein
VYLILLAQIIIIKQENEMKTVSMSMRAPTGPTKARVQPGQSHVIVLYHYLNNELITFQKTMS